MFFSFSESSELKGILSKLSDISEENISYTKVNNVERFVRNLYNFKMFSAHKIFLVHVGDAN